MRILICYEVWAEGIHQAPVATGHSFATVRRLSEDEINDVVRILTQTVTDAAVAASSALKLKPAIIRSVTKLDD